MLMRISQRYFQKFQMKNVEPINHECKSSSRVEYLGSIDDRWQLGVLHVIVSGSPMYSTRLAMMKSISLSLTLPQRALPSSQMTSSVAMHPPNAEGPRLMTGGLPVGDLCCSYCYITYRGTRFHATREYPRA